MPRPRTEIGQWGAISSKQQPDGRWRVWTRYRDTDGELRLVEAYGPSTAAGTRKLRQVLAKRGKDQTATISAATNMQTLGRLWLDERERTGQVSAQSLAMYRAELDTAICAPKTGIAKVSIREATTARIDAFLAPIAAAHPAKAKRVRVVLTGMLGMAVRHGATEVNPVREVAPIRAAAKDVRSLSLGELAGLRERVRLWQTYQLPGDAGNRGGSGRNGSLLDLVDVMLGTGCRVGEVLALRWQDVDLGAEVPTVTVAGTVVRLPGRKVAGGGLVRQASPKSDSSFRTVKLPAFTVQTLMRLKFDSPSGPEQLVFPSRTGGLRDPHNLRRQWREARGEDFAWVSPHSFRKTVATLLDREASTVDAAAQLGHSGEAVTRRHYIEKAAAAPDNRNVLDKLSGDHL